MLKTIIKRFGLAVLLGMAVLGVGYAAAVLIASRLGRTVQDVLFVEGIIVAALGLMMSMKGNPSGASLTGLGMPSANQVSNWHLEATRVEHEQMNDSRHFLNNAIIEISFVSVAILLGGIFLVLFSILSA